MKKILFTKELEKNWLNQNLTNKIHYEICPLLDIEIYQPSDFVGKIDPNSSKFIVSSQNSAKAIANLKLEGEFFVVGQNTAKKLSEDGKKIKHFENYAFDLGNYILRNYEPQSWNFFCGNNRRETLFELLRTNGHTVNEIICYASTPQKKKVPTSEFDAVVFFSPLAVKTYFSISQSKQDVHFFSIGETTTSEIIKHTNHKIITSEIPTKEKLIKKINEYYDSEK